MSVCQLAGAGAGGREGGAFVRAEQNGSDREEKGRGVREGEKFAGFVREGETRRGGSGDWKSRGLCWRVHDGYVPGLHYGLGEPLFPSDKNGKN